MVENLRLMEACPCFNAVQWFILDVIKAWTRCSRNSSYHRHSLMGQLKYPECWIKLQRNNIGNFCLTRSLLFNNCTSVLLLIAKKMYYNTSPKKVIIIHVSQLQFGLGVVLTLLIPVSSYWFPVLIAKSVFSKTLKKGQIFKT